jgi:hypothetical protein
LQVEKCKEIVQKKTEAMEAVLAGDGGAPALGLKI